MTEVQERRKKTVEASMTEQVHLIMQQHLNGGGRLFGGALMQWLDEMEQHEDIAVRGGVKLAREYVQSLQKEIENFNYIDFKGIPDYYIEVEYELVEKN